MKRINLKPGETLANKYEVIKQLGAGWEGEVYLTREKGTDIERTAKLFYPERNSKNLTAKRYAKKLHQLRNSNAVIQYHHQEVLEFGERKLTCLFSEFVDGELLTGFVARQPGKRLHPFQAVTLLYYLCVGVEKIHAMGEYHGDLHSDNVLVKPLGIGFEVKVFDFYHWDDTKPSMIKKDVCDLIRVFYDSLGGASRYKHISKELKGIICGLKTTLINKKFKRAGDLRRHLETLQWEM